MSLDEARVVYLMGRLASVVLLLEDQFLYGECFMTPDGWRIAPQDVVLLLTKRGCLDAVPQA